MHMNKMAPTVQISGGSCVRKSYSLVWCLDRCWHCPLVVYRHYQLNDMLNIHTVPGPDGGNCHLPYVVRSQVSTTPGFRHVSVVFTEGLSSHNGLP